MTDPHPGAAADPFGQRGARVRFDWGPAGAAACAPGCRYAVVVDVLSFTTAVSAAVDAGLRVYPYAWRDDSAFEFAHERGARLAVGRLEAARAGAPADAVSLSPVSLASTQVPEGGVVLPSPNGSTISAALADSGATVLAACLRNARAVGAWIAEALADDPSAATAVIAAGERWPDGSLRPAVEDLWGAALVLKTLQRNGIDGFSIEAVTAAAMPVDVDTLPDVVSGRELIGLGFGADVGYAGAVDASVTVPVLREGAFAAAPVSSGRSAHRRA